jgi:hypothetical protein
VEVIRAVITYLQYVFRHKYFVYREGRKLGVSRWQLFVHDWTKFSRAEFEPYVVYFNLKDRWAHDPVKKRQVKDEFDRAWLHHIHKNPHHWQHWVLRTDTEGVKVLEIPDKFVREMCADWEGVGAAFGQPMGHAARWYIQNRETMALHPLTRLRVEALLCIRMKDGTLIPKAHFLEDINANAIADAKRRLALAHDYATVSLPINREPGS